MNQKDPLLGNPVHTFTFLNLDEREINEPSGEQFLLAATKIGRNEIIGSKLDNPSRRFEITAVDILKIILQNHLPGLYLLILSNLKLSPSEFNEIYFDTLNQLNLKLIGAPNIINSSFFKNGFISNKNIYIRKEDGNPALTSLYSIKENNLAALTLLSIIAEMVRHSYIELLPFFNSSQSNSRSVQKDYKSPTCIRFEVLINLLNGPLSLSDITNAIGTVHKYNNLDIKDDTRYFTRELILKHLMEIEYVSFSNNTYSLSTLGVKAINLLQFLMNDYAKDIPSKGMNLFRYSQGKILRVEEMSESYKTAIEFAAKHAQQSQTIES